ncbi:MAG: UDP-galactopyranose mutase [Lachnospiraceae bacterium]|nr:UDP-galactopyranose mutase [Lachnospiraceae bacterium]
MNDYVIDVDRVSIRFNLASEKVDNLKEYAIKLMKHELMFQEFLALQDVSLKVKKGESWGLIGTNGSGKSTLLKTISGILQPYKGTVTTKGTIAPLIELGAGFDGNLTGRENIYLNGMVLGHSRKFMDEHFDEIVQFANLKKFLDSPIKNFSSGMKARLGFSVATVVNPDILIVDEVLEVGDYNFRRRCQERMQQMLSGGTTLLFVSHNIQTVKNLCDNAIWLDKGVVRMAGPSELVCTAYKEEQDRIAKEKKEAKRRKLREAKKPYDYLIVGAGLYGAVFASEMTKKGKRCLVIDKRDHIGGNVYTKDVDGIQVHQYGAHIFHTSDKQVWNYVNKLTEFNNYINSPVAVYKDELYNLPFNMNTFSRLWNLRTPKEVQAKIQEQIADLHITEPKNLEEQALSLVGKDVYEKLIKGYTEKQWGRDCKELPAFIIRRLPLRFTYDNNYFNDRYQGIPVGGYTQMVEKLLDNIDVMLETDFFTYRKEHPEMFKKVVYTGMIDEYFDYCYGHLEYRTVRFETERLEEENHQGNAVVNYTEREVPYTRVIEHKHFAPEEEREHPKDFTIISREYSTEWKPGIEPYYPVNDEKNSALYEQYAELAKKEKDVIFGGRLGQYKYYDMDKVIRAALDAVNEAGRK